MKLYQVLLATAFSWAALPGLVSSCDICGGREFLESERETEVIFDNIILSAFRNGNILMSCGIAKGLSTRFAVNIPNSQCEDIQSFADPCCGAPLPTPAPVPTPTPAPVITPMPTIRTTSTSKGASKAKPASKGKKKPKGKK